MMNVNIKNLRFTLFFFLLEMLRNNGLQFAAIMHCQVLILKIYTKILKMFKEFFLNFYKTIQWSKIFKSCYKLKYL